MVGQNKLKKLGVLVLACGLPILSAAQVYKYQDEEGRWHFTDCPPAGTHSTLIQKKEEAAEKISRDLAADLQKKYDPQSPIERASLAVVSIKTRLTEGSGFFISDKGHILTNRHVVKASETEEWKALQQAVESKKKAYSSAKKRLDKSRARLDAIAKELESYKRAIDEATSSYAKRVAEADYRYRKHSYDAYRADYEGVLKNFKKSRRAFEKARSEFNWQTSAATLERQFKIVLKDDTELTARLVSVCEEHDMALLRLDDHRTPFLKPANPDALSHGQRVYAIGSPYGMRDTITSGIITSFQDDYVVTDATVLPGSSGGPLVTEEGEVVGVNTLKVAEFVSAEGFGAAIPINIIREVYGDLLN